MSKLCLAFLCYFLGGTALAVERPFLKAECLPELGIFEVRLLRFEQVPDMSFLDKSNKAGSAEYELLKDKYGIIYEYQVVKDEERKASDNFLTKECVIFGAKYVIQIDHWGTTISKDGVLLADKIFFESAWNEWQIFHLIYNVKRQEFIVGGVFAAGLPMLYFSFSTKGNKVLTEDVIEKKGEVFLEKLIQKNGMIRYYEAMNPIVIDYD